LPEIAKERLSGNVALGANSREMKTMSGFVQKSSNARFCRYADEVHIQNAVKAVRKLESKPIESFTVFELAHLKAILAVGQTTNDQRANFLSSIMEIDRELKRRS